MSVEFELRRNGEEGITLLCIELQFPNKLPLPPICTCGDAPVIGGCGWGVGCVDGEDVGELFGLLETLHHLLLFKLSLYLVFGLTVLVILWGRFWVIANLLV
jgi:hypothetical protein